MDSEKWTHVERRIKKSCDSLLRPMPPTCPLRKVSYGAREVLFLRAMKHFTGVCRVARKLQFWLRKRQNGSWSKCIPIFLPKECVRTLKHGILKLMGQIIEAMGLEADAEIRRIAMVVTYLSLYKVSVFWARKCLIFKLDNQ